MSLDRIARVFGALVTSPQNSMNKGGLKRHYPSSSESSPTRPGFVVGSESATAGQSLASVAISVPSSENTDCQPAFRPVRTAEVSESPLSIDPHSVVSIDAIVERFKNVMSDALDGKLDEIQKSVSAIADKLHHLGKEVCEVRTEMNVVRTAQDRMEVMVRRHDAILTATDDRIAHVERHVADMQKLYSSDLAAKVSELESSVSFFSDVHDKHGDAPSKPRPNVDFAAYVEEELDKERRLNNVIVRGVPDHWADGELRQKCGTLFSCPESDILDIERLSFSSRRTNHLSSDSASPRPPPLVRVRFCSLSAKIAVQQKKFSLKTDGRPVYINHDLTRKQRADRKANLPTYKSLRARHVKCSLPFGNILDDKGQPFTQQSINTLLSPATQQ